MDVKSEAKLTGVHPDLVRVIRRAAELHPLTFIVTEGLRTVERQAALVKAGASRTMNSRHITGHAVDLAVKVDGVVRWDWPLYHDLAKTIKLAAAEEKVPVTCGADWKKFPDGPHVELPFKEYWDDPAA